MANIEFYQDESDRKEWRWRVAAADGTILGKSTEGYSRRTYAENNLRTLPQYARSVDIKIAANAGERDASARLPLEFYIDEANEWRWRVTAGNGNIVHGSVTGEASKDAAVASLEVLVAAVQEWSAAS